MLKSRVLTFDDGFEYTLDEDDIVDQQVQRPMVQRSQSPVIKGEQAADLQEQIRVLIDLWDLEPFYFRNVPRKFYETFEMCRNDPPGTIEFEDFDLVDYKAWLEAIVQTNDSNNNYRDNLACVAASLGLNDLITTYILMKKDIIYQITNSNGNNPLSLAMHSHHTEIVNTLQQTGNFRPVADVDSTNTNQYTNHNVVNGKITVLINFLHKYPRLLEKLDAVTAIKMRNLVRTQHFRHDIQNNPLHYQYVMQSLASRKDGLALRYAIHQGDPAFLSELLKFDPDAVRKFIPERNQTNLVEYGIQVWDSAANQSADRFTNYGRIMQILAIHGADLSDRANAPGQKTVATGVPLVGTSFTGPQGTSAQSSVSSIQKKLRTLSIDL